MKCISLKQPWASLFAWRLKQNETRKYYFSALDSLLHGPQWVAVHASSTWARDQRELLTTEPFKSALASIGITAGNDTDAVMPRGAIVSVTRFIGLHQTGTNVANATLSEQERAFGDYDPGRWVYYTSAGFRLARPVRMTGRLGVWELHPDIEHQVLVALQACADLPPELTSEALVDEAITEAVARKALLAEVDALLAGQGRTRRTDTRTPIERMIDKAVDRG